MKKKSELEAGADWGEVDEKTLVAAAQKGNDEAFEELFKRFRGKVFSIAFRYTRNYDEALDITQEVFLKIFKAIKGYRKESGLLTWLCRIAINTCIDRHRTKGAQSETELKEEMDMAGRNDALASKVRNPGSEALRSELREKIEEAMEKLSPKHRTVFVLHVEEGHSYKEIAEMTKCSIGTVMSRLHHARKYLRKYLSKYVEADQVKSYEERM